DYTPTIADLDTNGQARYDFLFVVTPESVMAAQMQDSSKSANYPYTPYRFMSKGDCVSSDPDLPSFPGDCNTNRILRYGLKIHGVESAGDPDATSGNPADPITPSTRYGLFPICALQPKTL